MKCLPFARHNVKPGIQRVKRDTVPVPEGNADQCWLRFRGKTNYLFQWLLAGIVELVKIHKND